MKSANENNCQFRFVNKFTKSNLADIANPKQHVLATVMHVMDAESHETAQASASAPHPPQRSLNNSGHTGYVAHPPLAFNSSSLELQILRTQAELMAVNRRNCEMQDQLQDQQAKIEQLSLALHEAVQAEAVQPRLREVCLPRLSAPAAIEPTPVTVELDHSGNPISLQSWNPEVITISATQETLSDPPSSNLAVRVDLPTFPRPRASRQWP